LRDGGAQLRLLVVERIAFQRGLRVLRDLAEGWQDVFQILGHCGRQPCELFRDVRDGAHILRACNVVRGQFDERVTRRPTLSERLGDIGDCLLRKATVFFSDFNQGAVQAQERQPDEFIVVNRRETKEAMGSLRGAVSAKKIQRRVATEVQ